MPESINKIGVTVVVLAVAAIWLTRYDIVEARYDNGPSAYVLDRWTRSVTLYTGVFFKKTRERPASQLNAPSQ